MFQQHVWCFVGRFCSRCQHWCCFKRFLVFLILVNDQASIQASGLRSGGREGHPGARLLQTHRLGAPREQGDTASLQTQSGTYHIIT